MVNPYREARNVQGSGKTRGKRKRKADSETSRKGRFSRRPNRRWKRKMGRSLSMWNTRRGKRRSSRRRLFEKGEEREERKQQAAAGYGVLAASQVIHGRGPLKKG